MFKWFWTIFSLGAPDVMSSTAFCGRILLAPRKKDGESGTKTQNRQGFAYDVEVIEVDTTRKQLKIHFVGFSHEYVEWRDYDSERNYFPFVHLEKNVFPRGRFAGG